MTKSDLKEHPLRNCAVELLYFRLYLSNCGRFAFLISLSTKIGKTGCKALVNDAQKRKVHSALLTGRRGEVGRKDGIWIHRLFSPFLSVASARTFVLRPPCSIPHPKSRSE